MIPAPPGISFVIPKSAFNTGVSPPLLMIGDKVKVGAETRKLFNDILKKHYMVARLKKKEFKPMFIVTNAFSPSNLVFQANLKPYNF